MNPITIIRRLAATVRRIDRRILWGSDVTIGIYAHNGETFWNTLSWRHYSTPDGRRRLNSPGPLGGTVDLPASQKSVNGSVVPREDAQRYVEEALKAAGWRLVDGWGYQKGETWGFYSSVEARITSV